MPYNRTKMSFNKTPKDVTLQVPVHCDTCGLVRNEDCPEGIHDGGVELVELKVVGVPWARRNYIKSQCISFDENQRTHFDSNQYANECLKIMIKEAPWGNTDDIFLLQVSDELGAALETLLPKLAVETTTEQGESFSDIKKE